METTEEGRVDVEESQRMLMAPLTEAEVAEHGKVMSALNRKRIKLVDERKEKSKELKADIDDAQERIDQLAREIENGREKMVDVRIEKDFPASRVRVIRMDTGEVLEDRIMHTSEKQRAMDFDEDGSVEEGEPDFTAWTDAELKHELDSVNNQLFGEDPPEGEEEKELVAIHEKLLTEMDRRTQAKEQADEGDDDAAEEAS